MSTFDGKCQSKSRLLRITENNVILYVEPRFLTNSVVLNLGLTQKNLISYIHLESWQFCWAAILKSESRDTLQGHCRSRHSPLRLIKNIPIRTKHLKFCLFQSIVRTHPVIPHKLLLVKLWYFMAWKKPPEIACPILVFCDKLGWKYAGKFLCGCDWLTDWLTGWLTLTMKLP